jgi:hypothetical protein
VKKSKVAVTLIVLMLVTIVVGGIYFYQIDKEKINTSNPVNEEESPTDIPYNEEDSDAPINDEDASSSGEEQVSNNKYPAYQYIDGDKYYGFINEVGEFTIKPQYGYASVFNESVAVVSNSNKYQLIDLDGNILFASDRKIGDFKNGASTFSQMVGSEYLYGYIDKTGKVIVKPQYTAAYDFNEEQQAIVRISENEYSLINIKGEIISTHELGAKYGYIYQLEDEYVVYNNTYTQKYGVDTFSGEIIYEAIYSEIKYLGEGLFAMKDPELESYEISPMAPWALFNNKGEQITDYILYDISNFKNGYASVTDSASTYFIDVDGKEATEFNKFTGRGTLVLIGDMIKGEIDNELLYATKDGVTVFQSVKEYNLGSGIVSKGMKYKPNKYVLVSYPRIEGLKDSQIETKINEEIENIFTQYRKELKEEDALSVEVDYSIDLRNNLLTVVMTGYDYSFGATHGMPLMEYNYININTGEFYQLKDLFKEDSDYTSKINELINIEINKRIEEDEDSFFSDAFTGIKEEHNFILLEDSIIIYFYPYDIAPYGEGFPEFAIQLGDIMELINTDGELYKAFH